MKNMGERKKIERKKNEKIERTKDLAGVLCNRYVVRVEYFLSEKAG